MNIETNGLLGPSGGPGDDRKGRLSFVPKKRLVAARDDRATEPKTQDCNCSQQEGRRIDCGTLMAAAQRGDAASYRHLLGGLRSWLERYYRCRLPMLMVEDAVQDTLIAIHNKRHTYEAPRPFEPWLTAIARYQLTKRLRTTKRVRFEPLNDSLSHNSPVISTTIMDGHWSS